MRARMLDPRHVDVAALAAASAQLEGRWPLNGFARLGSDHPADGPAIEGDVQWRVSGEQRAVAGSGPQVWLHLGVSAFVHRTCQRCLRPVEIPLRVDRWLRFAPDEATAAELDVDSEDDVLALERSLDLHDLVEDELLLALPMVPRHDRCPQPLPAPAGSHESPSADAAEHSLAALAHWRGKLRKQ